MACRSKAFRSCSFVLQKSKDFSACSSSSRKSFTFCLWLPFPWKESWQGKRKSLRETCFIIVISVNTDTKRAGKGLSPRPPYKASKTRFERMGSHKLNGGVIWTDNKSGAGFLSRPAKVKFSRKPKNSPRTLRELSFEKYMIRGKMMSVIVSLNVSSTDTYIIKLFILKVNFTKKFYK